MTGRRFILLLATSLIVIAGAMYLSSLRHLDRDPRGAAFLGGLQTQLDAITDIRLRKGSSVPILTLHRNEPGHWGIAERDNYPADVSKVRRLLLALSDAKVVEEKTSNPANYARLGVEDAQNTAAGGVEVTLQSPAKSVSVIVGRMGGGGSYVRRSGEAKSFVVDPPVSVDTGVRDWIDTRLFDIALDKIQRIHLKPADGSGYTLSRTADPKNPAAAPFKLDTVPPGREANDAATLAPSPTTFSAIPADDVAAAGSIDFAKPAVLDIAMLDGSTYAITGTVIADKHWITLTASKDDALNVRSRGRAFEIAGYRYDALFRPVEQLLKPKATPASAKSVSAPNHKPALKHP
jgi:hypothetical protein